MPVYYAGLLRTPKPDLSRRTKVYHVFVWSENHRSIDESGVVGATEIRRCVHLAARLGRTDTVGRRSVPHTIPVPNGRLVPSRSAQGRYWRSSEASPTSFQSNLVRPGSLRFHTDAVRSTSRSQTVSSPPVSTAACSSARIADHHRRLGCR